MIILLCGENDFELRAELVLIKRGSEVAPERYDGSELTNEQLADIFAGQSLFALKRFVVIDNPAASTALWHDLPAWMARLSTDTQLVFVEPKPDKRTTTYKWLKKNADVREFASFDERDTAKASKWLSEYAKEKGTTLTRDQVSRLIDRGGVNQAELAQAVDKLALADEINDTWIDAVIEPNPTQNIFALFETVLGGDPAKLQTMIATLKLTEDPYRVFGLVISQGLQLALLVYSGGNINQVAGDMGMKSSYPLQKMSSFAAKLTRDDAAQMIHLLAGADKRLKSSDADPWLVLESTLVQVASLKKR